MSELLKLRPPKRRVQILPERKAPTLREAGWRAEARRYERMVDIEAHSLRQLPDMTVQRMGYAGERMCSLRV